MKQFSLLMYYKCYYIISTLYDYFKESLQYKIQVNSGMHIPDQDILELLLDLVLVLNSQGS